MSNHWRLECVDCGVQKVFHDSNHKGAELHAIAQLAPRLAEVHALLEALRATDFASDVVIALGRDSLDTAWFLTHRGHAIVAVDQYGHRYDDCAAFFTCAHCGHSVTCHRKEGHEGEHSEEREGEGDGVRAV